MKMHNDFSAFLNSPLKLQSHPDYSRIASLIQSLRDDSNKGESVDKLPSNIKKRPNLSKLNNPYHQSSTPFKMQPLGDNTVNVPAFLGKLWKMVNDPETDQLICWNSSGTSFMIQNQAQFWYDLLPVYYKHNNMSSFVRQLNMYGFHKVSSVENGTMDADKDEIIFFHPYFQKDKVELLKNIKRKVTGPKTLTENTAHNSVKSDVITKVLQDVKQIRGRQATVDSQLSAMKQENAVLWRELALLRQKHMKQQQIVNKLIHFLITLVQPGRMGVGVKRRLPLMLCERPVKKSKHSHVKQDTKQRKKNGPIIHELDSEIDQGPNELYEEIIDQQSPVVNSPSPETSTSSTSPRRSSGNIDLQQLSSDMLNDAVEISEEDNISRSGSPPVMWDKPDFVEPDDYILVEDEALLDSLPNLDSEEIAGVAQGEMPSRPYQSTPDMRKVFLNPNTQDTLLSNLINGSYNINALNLNKNQNSGKNQNVKRQSTKGANAKAGSNTVKQEQDVSTDDGKSMTVATKNDAQSNLNIDDLHNHVGSTQSDLEQLKDLLAGCSGLDANALLGLLKEDAPEYILGGTNETGKDSDTAETSDPLVSGSELTPYGMNMIDFNQLFDDSTDNQDLNVADTSADLDLGDDIINTPQLEGPELTFPTNRSQV